MRVLYAAAGLAVALTVSAPALAKVYTIHIDGHVLSGNDTGKDVAGKPMSLKISVDTAVFSPPNQYTRAGVDIWASVDGRPIRFDSNAELPPDIIWGGISKTDQIQMGENEYTPGYYPGTYDVYNFYAYSKRVGAYDACDTCNFNFYVEYDLNMELYSLDDFVDGNLFTAPKNATLYLPTEELNFPYDGYIVFYERWWANYVVRDVSFRWIADSYRVSVPEPATWSLLIGGFGIAGAALRRRKAKDLGEASEAFTRPS